MEGNWEEEEMKKAERGENVADGNEGRRRGKSGKKKRGTVKAIYRGRLVNEHGGGYPGKEKRKVG